MKKNAILLLIFILSLSCSDNVIEVTKQKNKDNGVNSVITGGVLNTSAPASTVKLCFIHHSTGSAWISSGSGTLGAALNANNYYVTECDYGWDAELNDNLGDSTDTPDWPLWFTNTIMPFVYANTSHYDYNNAIPDTAGENEIIMFKSCYPNSEVGASIAEKQTIYNNLLPYFAAHTDKMFVLIIPPPERIISSAALTRQLSSWLVDREHGWLASYAHNNVYAFNYYNILTDPNNHHRVNSSGYEENIITDAPADPLHPNELYYPTGDDHPSSTGHQKATDEFIELLNGWYHLWKNN